MALTDIQLVRIKISDKSTITREESEGDALSTNYKLEHAPVLTSPVPLLWINDSLKTEGVDYTIDYTNGIITWAVAPAVNDDIVTQYYWSIFTDEEIQAFLDDAGNVTVASARLLLAIAADAARLAKRQTLAGGGGLGSATIDTSVVARELRNTAQALLSIEADIAADIPAEGITEVPWTESNYRRLVDEDFYRNS